MAHHRVVFSLNICDARQPQRVRDTAWPSPRASRHAGYFASMNPRICRTPTQWSSYYRRQRERRDRARSQPARTTHHRVRHPAAWRALVLSMGGQDCGRAGGGHSPQNTLGGAGFTARGIRPVAPVQGSRAARAAGARRPRQVPELDQQRNLPRDLLRP